MGDSSLLAFGIHVPVRLLERCMGEAKSGIAFNERSFGLVRAFLEKLERNNPLTTALFEEMDGRFRRALLLPGMCVNAFHHSTRVIGVDGCHIKSKYCGVILVVSVLDGNGNVFPAAFGFVEGENKGTWSWFLSAVRTGLGIDDGGDGIVILSDREKGIKKAVKRLFPIAAHSYCVFHIQKNVKLHFKTTLDGLLFKAAKAPTKMDFRATMEEIKTLHGAAGEYIAKILPERLVWAFFPRRRFGHVTSNLAESMNHWFREARHLDPIGALRRFI